MTIKLTTALFFFFLFFPTLAFAQYFLYPGECKAFDTIIFCIPHNAKANQTFSYNITFEVEVPKIPIKIPVEKEVVKTEIKEVEKPYIPPEIYKTIEKLEEELNIKELTIKRLIEEVKNLEKMKERFLIIILVLLALFITVVIIILIASFIKAKK